MYVSSKQTLYILGQYLDDARKVFSEKVYISGSHIRDIEAMNSFYVYWQLVHILVHAYVLCWSKRMQLHWIEIVHLGKTSRITISKTKRHQREV